MCPRPSSKTLEQVARIGNTLIQMHVNNKDRFRLWRTLVKFRARRLAKGAISGLKKLARLDG